MSELKRKIEALRPQLVIAAQKVYDDWEQDEEGHCDWLGYGGICQDIADEQAEILEEHGIDAASVSSSHEQHVFVLAFDNDEAYVIDIYPGVYETGGGFCWRKIPDVEFDWQDVVVERVDRNEYIDEEGEFYDI